MLFLVGVSQERYLPIVPTGEFSSLWLVLFMSESAQIRSLFENIENAGGPVPDNQHRNFWLV